MPAGRLHPVQRPLDGLLPAGVGGVALIRGPRRLPALVHPPVLAQVVDIHPANKLDVGHRLARGAEALTYGGKASPSGPWPVEARFEGAVVRVRFTGADKGLVTYSAAQPIGFELCGTAPGSCRFATATLAGSDVLVAVGAGAADRVRFCWGYSPICNLYYDIGLPATPFELPVR